MKVKTKVTLDEVCRRLCPEHQGIVCPDLKEALQMSYQKTPLPDYFYFEGEIEVNTGTD